MVAVATGDVSVVCDWAIALTAAGIPFRMAGPCDDRHAELFVRDDVADQARAVLRGHTTGKWVIW
jgi:hypothetical protein